MQYFVYSVSLISRWLIITVIVGASLSECHTHECIAHVCVCLLAYFLGPTTYCKISNEHITIFWEDLSVHSDMYSS